MLRKAMTYLTAAAAIGCTSLPVALACWRYSNGANPGLENPPTGCTGQCAAYWGCDRSDTCVSWRLSGFSSCPCNTVTQPCDLYYNGTVDAATGCCYGGAIAPRGTYDPGPSVTITKCTPMGYGCGF